MVESLHHNTSKAVRANMAHIEAIALGDRKKNNSRAMQGETCESIEAQVEALIDMATDPNLLGRTWGGWEAWM